MTTYVFQPTTANQSVDWSDPAVWIGGVVPDGPSAEVVFPVVTLNGGGTDTSFISIASDESYSVDSVSLASNYLTVDGDLAVATDFAIQARRRNRRGRGNARRRHAGKRTDSTSRGMAKSPPQAF